MPLENKLERQEYKLQLVGIGVIRLLVLLGIVGMSDAYAGVAGRYAVRARALLVKKTVGSVALLSKLRLQQAGLLAKDQDTAPDQRRVERKDSSPDRVERGDTVGRSGGSSGSHRRDSWERSTPVFDERYTGRRGGSAP